MASRRWRSGWGAVVMRLAAIAMALAWGGVTASRAHAMAVLDQQHSFTSSVANTTSGNVAEVGQAFTVGIEGTLDHIDVLMFRLGGIFDPVGDPILSVYNTSGGLPTGSPLTTVSVAESLVPLSTAAFVTFDVSTAAIAVDVSDVLAFGVTAASGSGPYFLLADSNNYAGGDAVSRFPPGAWSAFSGPQDHGFRTFVVPVPEPTTGLMLAATGLTLARRRRRA